MLLDGRVGSPGARQERRLASKWPPHSVREDAGSVDIMRCSEAFKRFSADERGFVVSSELIMISTIVVFGLLVGLAAARDAVVSELSDVAGSLQDLNQSYSVDGVVYHNSNVAGFDFFDELDECDSADQSENDVNPEQGKADNCIIFSDDTLNDEGDDDFQRSG